MILQKRVKRVLKYRWEGCIKKNVKLVMNSLLKTHICQIHVTNPTLGGTLYMKNWYVKKECPDDPPDIKNEVISRIRMK